MSIEDTNKGKNIQGVLFETKVVFDSTDPGMSRSHQEYAGEPTYQGIEPESNSVSSKSNNVESQSDTQPLDILRTTVDLISAANQRSGFGRAPLSRVQQSASKRRLSLRQAEEQAHRNASELIEEAEIHYAKLQTLAQQAIALTSLFAPNSQTVKVASFDEFVERVSGPQNKNLRRSIKHSREKWRDRDTGLLINSPAGYEPNSVEKRSAEHKVTSTKDKYLPLLPRFMAEKYSEPEPLDEQMSRVWKYANTDCKGHPGRVMMSSADRSSFVWDPAAYKKSLSEGGTLRKDADYKHKLSDKIVQLQKRRSDFVARELKLRSVLPIVDGTMPYGDKPKTQQDAAAKLAEAHKILSQEIELLGETRGWDEEKTMRVKERLDGILLSGKLPNGESVSRRDSWLEAIDAVRKHLGRQVAIFDKDIKLLNGKPSRSTRPPKQN